MRDEALDSARILVVDDEETNVFLLIRLLERAGFSDIQAVTDPRLVPSLVRSMDPDLILLDLLMPDFDGVQVIEGVRALLGPTEFLPIVVLTADASDTAKRRALEAGADDFVAKPFLTDEVVLRVRNHLRTRFLYQDLQRERDGLEARVAQRTAALQQSLDRLRLAHETRRRLIRHLVRAQEEERETIAGDIHDDSVQVMTAVSLRLALLRATLPPEADDTSLAELETTVVEAIRRLRRLLFELRPTTLDDEGLAAAIEEYAARAEREEGTEIVLTDLLSSEPAGQQRVVLFRILQEAMTNARKHAEAARVEVTLENRDDGFGAVVRDNGRGFDPSEVQPMPGHIGLASMRERAELVGGWLEVESRPGDGTTVRCWIPAEDPSPEGTVGTDPR